MTDEVNSLKKELEHARVLLDESQVRHTKSKIILLLCAS
jgi:hypothetical protein